jgi:hypothetical protein
VLVDTGPLVAFFDVRERHHRRVLATWQELEGPVATILPVVTECLHLIGDAAAARDGVLDLLRTGAMTLLTLERSDVPRVHEVMKRYAELPADFADACLVRVAEREGIRTVFTLDRRGFETYAPRHVRRFALLPAHLG